MKPSRLALLYGLLAACLADQGDAREWTDSTGHYTIQADLVAFNDQRVILQREDREMVAMAIEDLSPEDRQYLETQEAVKVKEKILEKPQTWTLRDGTKVVGRIVDFAHREVTFQRRRSRTFVNDRRLDTLPEFYQKLAPKIIAHFEEQPIDDLTSMNTWLMRQRGRAQSYHLEGVIFEVASGDEFAVPFFLFSDEDLDLLKSSWTHWKDAHQAEDFDRLDELAFHIETLAAARQHDAEVNRGIAKMQLQLQAVQAGVTNLWEVTLYPAEGQGGWPLWVVVPGRDSRDASFNAMQQNPGFVVGPVRRVSRF